MASFNRIILLGNLTRDPQLRYLPSQTPVVDFGLACNRRFKDSQGQDREEAMFIDCSAFGKQAEIINQYCRKGNLLMVEGRIKLDVWEDKQGGGKRSKHTVAVENFQLMPNREQPDAHSNRTPALVSAPKPPAHAQPPYDEQPQFRDDSSIPF